MDSNTDVLCIPTHSWYPDPLHKHLLLHMHALSNCFCLFVIKTIVLTYSLEAVDNPRWHKQKTVAKKLILHLIDTKAFLFAGFFIMYS